MPVMPSSLLEPAWVQFEALLPPRAVVHPDHPLGCHRARIADRVVFELVVAALVYGCGYERVATGSCSDSTIRRRLKDWAHAGLGDVLHTVALGAYETMIGLDLDVILVDGCITKAVCGGDLAGPSPVDRAKGGIKRSQATDATGIPLAQITAPANRHDSPLLAPTLDAAHAHTGHLWPDLAIVALDAGYDSQITRDLLKERGLAHDITWKGFPEPIENTRRWPCERTHAWMNGYGKLRRITDKNPRIIDFYFSLAATFVIIRAIIQAARKTHRWEGRPTTRRLK